MSLMRRSDAYNLSERLGDAVITGPSANHLRDLRILLMPESFVSN
jgi:glycerate-2-kinase